MGTDMNKRLITLSMIIFAIAMFRVLPHPPNVSPVAAMALFGGAFFSDRRVAFLVPFLALLLSDIVIGLHDTMVYVYAGFALTVVIGFWIVAASFMTFALLWLLPCCFLSSLILAPGLLPVFTR